jgi:catechol 2,3-dioxygenase-like lactoylglutathione lyase family enzyme
MSIKLTKDSIDLGIVVSDGEKALKFYRDTLGFDHVATTPMPGGGGTMERLLCGTSLIKVVVPEKPLENRPARGGIQGAYGYRYWTISISNIDDVLAKCEAGGYRIVVPRRNIRPGVDIAIVEDPDGNWVEFLQAD